PRPVPGVLLPLAWSSRYGARSTQERRPPRPRCTCQWTDWVPTPARHHRQTTTASEGALAVRLALRIEGTQCESSLRDNPAEPQALFQQQGRAVGAFPEPPVLFRFRPALAR